MGPSADNSKDAPMVKVPAAMITGSSYPGMAQGSGVTWESTGDPIWIPRQNAQRFFGLPSSMAVMMSVLGAS